MSDQTIMPGWHVDEKVRAETIAAHDMNVLGQDAALTRITDFAAALCETPVAIVTLVEESCQRLIARTGIDITETPREVSFCQFAMVEEETMVVPDATQDARFAHNPLVTGEPGIRFYAGAPILASDGVPLGSLCVLDTTPRDGPTPLQLQGLAVLAADVMQRFDRNRRLRLG